MARRGATTEERSSQEENNPPPSMKVKAEKVRDSAKEEGSSKKHKGKQRAPLDDAGQEHDPIDEEQEDADGEEDSEGDEQDEGGSPKGRKRARVNDNGDAISNNGEGSAQPRERITTLPRDTDGFIPGSILRIQLKNFVTYDFTEFCPGAYLNMILGPNGTGKSSIACAICLGLNWPPSVLGRAADLNSFVKLGTDAGHVEIELKGPKGKPNLVIRRNLNARTNSSTFTLNGNTASGREITQRMSELNVQVGNLCSFLPQDKVSEFAAMSPQQLLRETQRAAGDENLTSWHDTLISSGKDLKKLQELLQADREQLKTMQERNEGIERDVQRYKERKRIEHEIELLNVLIPVQLYREILVQYNATKKMQRASHDRVQKLREKNAPAHEMLKKLGAQHNKFDSRREACKKSTKTKLSKMSAKWDESEKLEEETADLEEQIDSLKKSEKDRVKKIERAQADVAKIQQDIDQPVEIEREEDVMAEQQQFNLERQAIEADVSRLGDDVTAAVVEQEKYRAQINAASQDFARLDDVNDRKLQKLRQWDQNHYEAVLWLRRNKDKFKMEVFEPPIVSLNVSNRHFVDSVEACFNANQMKTFVMQCQEDYNTFNHFVNDSQALGKPVRINTWFRPDQGQSVAPPPLGRQEMEDLGFDGYAIDYVECAPGMKWWLKRELNLHRTAIGLDGRKVDVNKAMEAVTRIGPNGQGGGGATFIAGTVMNQVGRSRYGRRETQNLTRDIRPARNLGNANVDPDLKRQLEARLSEARRNLALADETFNALDAEYKQAKAGLDALEPRRTALIARKKAITAAHSKRHSLNAKLARAKDILKNLVEAPSTADKREQLRKKLVGLAKKRVLIATEYADLVRGVINDQVEATRVGLEYLQVGANKAALEVLCEKKDEKYNAAFAEFHRVDAIFKNVKARSKEILEQSRDVVRALDDELRAEFSAIEDARLVYEKERAKAEENDTTPPTSDGVELRSAEELQADLDIQTTNLEMNLNTNPGVVEQYEKRKLEIENLGKSIEQREAKAKRIERNIKHARDNWQPALEKLVASIGEKFSAAFDRIGCAGEVRVSEHEDYEKWAIDILVKFRDSEKLQLLTGQRQSGGERSLTTILYLMSLTEEARAPFSLVDEINQGMDQRAERNVHNSMVEVTCKPDSAQYFLITPKLLPDLQYHERMKVLCVNNGEWLPEERQVGNMMDMINAYVQRKPNGASNAA